MTADADEQPTNTLDPLVPRPIDLPTVLPPGGALDPEVGDIAKIFAAPADPAEWPRWRDDLASWREDAHRRDAYDGAAYDVAETAWTARAYVVALVWLWDERLFDRDAQRFDVDRWIAATAATGAVDGVVLWHAYPVIGIDDRNQFDFYRDVPGLRELIADFRSRGIRVFIDYNPWDTGTRRTGSDDATELGALVDETGADGVFLDTLKEGGADLVDAVRSRGRVLEGESRVPDARIADHQLSWAQWFADSDAPGVLRAHWYERRHMLHHTRRWNRDHGAELQSAWMNGVGVLLWDTVFGVWVGWSARDAATLRRMSRVQRALADVLIEGTWTPLDGTTPDARAAGVHASRWTRGGVTLWTIVNRDDAEHRGPVLVPSGSERLDLLAGRPLHGDLLVPARGIAAVLELDPGADRPEGLDALLEAARADPQEGPPASAGFPSRVSRRVPHPRSTGAAPDDAVRPAPGPRTLVQTWRRRETGWYGEAPYVEEWKPLPPRLHDDREETRTVELGAVAVATLEVSAAEYAEWVRAGGAESPDPTEAPDAPATRVTLDDARRYAASVGARLPDELEWQAAAETPGFGYRTPRVWNLTESEHSDGITRWSMLKGGSDFRAEGSDWYVDGGPRDPSFTLKLLATGLGMDRSPSIGFRLAWDLDHDGGAA